jgi:cob(I)alamin adenosyltransferase
VRITKVYTRKGDDGTTRLVGNHLVSKNSARIVAYGAVDELNSTIGLARSMVAADSSLLSKENHARILSELDFLQNLLFTAGADLATRVEDRWKDMPLIAAEHTLDLEARIDAYNKEIPPLEEFILPAGTPASASLHVARTVCRRAEREAIALRDQEPVGEGIIPFLNRLSDLLFVLARWLCLASGVEESLWKR